MPLRNPRLPWRVPLLLGATLVLLFVCTLGVDVVMSHLRIQSNVRAHVWNEFKVAGARNTILAIRVRTEVMKTRWNDAPLPEKPAEARLWLEASDYGEASDVLPPEKGTFGMLFVRLDTMTYDFGEQWANNGPVPVGPFNESTLLDWFAERGLNPLDGKVIQAAKDTVGLMVIAQNSTLSTVSDRMRSGYPHLQIIRRGFDYSYQDAEWLKFAPWALRGSGIVLWLAACLIIGYDGGRGGMTSLSSPWENLRWNLADELLAWPRP